MRFAKRKITHDVLIKIQRTRVYFLFSLAADSSIPYAITFKMYVTPSLSYSTDQSKVKFCYLFVIYLTAYAIYDRTRQIIRYRATATLRRPQIKQYTASKKVGVTKPTGTSYNFDKVWSGMVNPTAVSENNSSSISFRFLKGLTI